MKIAYRTPSSNPEVALPGSQKGKGEGTENFEKIMGVSFTNLGWKPEVVYGPTSHSYSLVAVLLSPYSLLVLSLPLSYTHTQAKFYCEFFILFLTVFQLNLLT